MYKEKAIEILDEVAKKSLGLESTHFETKNKYEDGSRRFQIFYIDDDRRFRLSPHHIIWPKEEHPPKPSTEYWDEHKEFRRLVIQDIKTNLNDIGISCNVSTECNRSFSGIHLNIKILDLGLQKLIKIK